MLMLKLTETEYSDNYFEINRPTPLTDKKIETTIQHILNGGLDKNISNDIYDNFKNEAEEWIFASKLNNIANVNSFCEKDIIIGCTQFIDNLYMQGQVQTLTDDYRYHKRMGLSKIQDVGNLIPTVPLILSMPFPSIGNVHDKIDIILDECYNKNIDIHIDGAWLTCSQNINFDLSHPCIKSFAVSLSKGLGLGWNRIGLRWTKSQKKDSITLMNNFYMSNKVLIMIGLHFIRNFEPDYLWNKHRERYYKVCNDFNLEPTNSIHLAKQNGMPVGISKLIRYLEND
jgi:hypothetical protein